MSSFAATAPITPIQRGLNPKTTPGGVLAPGCLARTQVDCARALGPGRRADELLDAAGQAATQLGLGAVARKVAALGAQPGAPV